MNTIGFLDSACGIWIRRALAAPESGVRDRAILSLGVGVGANTAIFQLLDAVRIWTVR